MEGLPGFLFSGGLIIVVLVMLALYLLAPFMLYGI